ncbi:MAG: sugar-binding domain-containing protein [Oscillospiraceae bacterium]
MNISNEKADKLVTIAKLYYEDNKTQNEIAAKLNISRPLVSRYLNEARTFGIVHIEIRSMLEGNNLLLNQVRNLYNIKGGIAVPDGADDTITNLNTAKVALGLLHRQQQLRCGLGWGSIIGAVISAMEEEEFPEGVAKEVCPMIGNSGVSNRDYHSNELVRVFARKTGAAPTYWHTPAIVASEQELLQMKDLENYKSICHAWENMDAAIVNIGNYPSVPDFATAARYGNKLAEEKAVGRFLCYYFDKDGSIIRSENDCIMQIPVETLARTPIILGICAGNVKPRALAGALRTGIFTHLIAPEDLIRGALEIN